MRFARITTLAGSLLLLAAGAHAQTAAMPSWANFKAGERWEWVKTDSRTQLEVSRQVRTVVEVDGRLRFSDGSNSTHGLDREFIGDPGNSKPCRVWPLALGEKWDCAFDWTSKAGSPGSTTKNFEVAAYEEVTVPAGTFMAFKIVVVGWQQYKQAQASTRLDDVVWYAPQARANVKRVTKTAGQNESTEVLLSYTAPEPSH